MNSRARFLSCDWGNSTFRLRLVDAGKKEASGELLSDGGMAETYQLWQAAARPETERINFYRSILVRSVNNLPGTFDKNTPILISGMVSSSIGLTELPYQKFPFTWDISQFIVGKIEEDEQFTNPLYLVSGFKTDDDVMRGEETLLLGCDPGNEGEKIFVFPGTHSKHVFVRDNRGIDFKTYMTGEIFNLLAEKSILRNAVSKGIDEKSFAEGLIAGKHVNLLHSAFSIRTRQLLQQVDSVSNYQYLSGLVIGAELKDLKNKDCPVYLVCSEHFKKAYMIGLDLMGFKKGVYYLDADDMLIKGHCKIADHYL
jgi:2-dehydro-3-deoxygalactonokinase